jgi:hypothetical protein
LFVWVDQEVNEIKGAIVRPDGSTRVGPFFVSNPATTSADLFEPKAAFKSGTNQYLVVFNNSDGGDNAFVLGSLLNSDGSSPTSSFLISDSSAVPRFGAVVAADPFNAGAAGRYLVSWAEADGDGTFQELAQLLDTNGVAQGGVLALSAWSATFGTQSHALGYGPLSDRFVHVTAGINNGGVWSRTISPADGSLGGISKFSDDNDERAVDLDCHPSLDQCLVSWIDSRSGTNAVYGSILDQFAAEVVDEFVIDNGAPDFAEGANDRPSVAAGSSPAVANSAFLVSYSRVTSDSNDIFATTVKSDGTITGGAQSVFSDGAVDAAETFDGYSAVAHRSAGEFMVAWEKDIFAARALETDIFARSFNMSSAVTSTVSMKISMDQATYAQSDSADLLITYGRGTSGATDADAYAVLQLPDGTFLFSPGYTPDVQTHRSNVPTNDELDAGLRIHNLPIAGVPAGTYTWYWALAVPGTFTFIGPIGSLPFTVLPF